MDTLASLVRGAVVLAFGAAVIGSVEVGADVARQGARQGLRASPIAELAAHQLFDASLPRDLPAEFRFRAPVAGNECEVVLAKHSCRADSFQVLVDAGDGKLTRVPDPVVRTYRGHLSGRPETIVTGSLLPSGFSGLIILEDGSNCAIQPLSDFRRDVPQSDRRHVSYAATDVIPDGRGCALGRRGFERFSKSHGLPAADGEGGIAGTTPSQVVIACETDYEFFQKNSSSVTNTVNDVELIVANVNTIYDRDANITHELGTIVVRSTSTDPYSGTTIDARLDEFSELWSATPESGIYRGISHMFSGYNYSGGTIGLAYLGGVCTGVGATQYGVVESRYTTTLTYRISLSAHELGHNWNADHCDSEGSANCHIMCSSNGGCGGISGANLKFDPTSVSEITGWLNTHSCDFTRPVAVTPPFTEPFASTTLATARWTYNDGGAVSSAATNEPTTPYSLLVNSSGGNAYDDDEVRTNFINLAGSSTATASYKVQRSGVESGKTLVIDYLNSSLDWTALNTITSDGSAQTTFTTYSHSLPANARHASFRLRFRPDGADSTDNWYIDDVSVVTVVNPPPPANDECIGATNLAQGSTAFDTTWATDTALALPTSCTASGDGTIVKDVWFKYVSPCAGRTAISTCGLAGFDTRIAVYGPTATCPGLSTPILACNDDQAGCASGTSSLSFNSLLDNTYWVRVGGATAGGAGSVSTSCTDCAADLNDDLYTDAGDLSALLANWGNSGMGDINGSGIVDGGDLAALLSAWGPCN